MAKISIWTNKWCIWGTRTRKTCSEYNSSVNHHKCSKKGKNKRKMSKILIWTCSWTSTMVIKFLPTNSPRRRRYQLIAKSPKFHPKSKLYLKIRVPIIYWAKIRIQLAVSATISAVKSGSKPKRKEMRPKNTRNNSLSSIKWSNSAKTLAGLKPRNRLHKSIKFASLPNLETHLTQTLASKAISRSLPGRFLTI